MAGQTLRLVVMGEQRSGTTLLARWLDAQTGLTVRSGYLGRLTHLASTQLGVRARAPLSARARHVLYHAARAERAALDGERSLPFGAEEVRSFSDLHRRMLWLQTGSAVDCAGHKIHGPVAALLDLLEEPDVRGVFLIRDVRDAMLSRWFRGDRLVDEPLMGWRRSAQAVLSCDNPRLLVLRFEDLVLDPAGTAYRVGELLGRRIDPEPAGMIDEGAGPAFHNTSFDDLERPLDPAAVERWRSYEEHPVVRYSGLVAASELSRFGYPSGGSHIGLRERVRYRRRQMTTMLIAVPRRAKDLALRRLLPTLGEEP